DAAAGVVHLADVAAGLRAEHAPGDARERRDAARTVGAELPVVLWADFARSVFLDVAAGELPFAAHLGQAGGDVDRRLAVGVGAAGVVDAHRRLARGGLEVDLAHRHAQRA